MVCVNFSEPPPPEAMDHSDEMSVANTKPQGDKNKQMIVKKKIEQYFQLITQGCNRLNCKNPNCASNPSNLKISGNEAAVKVRKIIFLKTYHRQYEIWICIYIQLVVWYSVLQNDHAHA